MPSARGSVGAPNTVPEDALNVKPGQLNLVYHQGCMPLFCIHLLNLQKKAGVNETQLESSANQMLQQARFGDCEK